VIYDSAVSFEIIKMVGFVSLSVHNKVKGVDILGKRKE